MDKAKFTFTLTSDTKISNDGDCTTIYIDDKEQKVYGDILKRFPLEGSTVQVLGEVKAD